MTISYNWLNDYLPAQLDPERLSKILTSIGLEVENLSRYEEIPGTLEGLVVGEVLTCGPHPNAGKLSLTTVNVGREKALQIVCGAPNVAAGQKVVVALVGSTLHPMSGEPMQIKTAKIRGEESQGMLCAEDEIGIGQSHAGIIVLPEDTRVGVPVAEVFHPYADWVYEIGLTPNRTDAMSHLGVARDICAYLSHHELKAFAVRNPFPSLVPVDNNTVPIRVSILNPVGCARYSGVSLAGIRIAPSPRWMQQRLKAIGVRPINNIVDITNYVLHESGQPLHAFDAAKIRGRGIVVQNLPEGTPFVTLDGKERRLHQEDLMICDSEGPICIAGVFGGLDSGIGAETTDVFLESAWFQPLSVRKTSIRHGLRTDAAQRFEKGVDISGTMPVLRRAAQLMKDLAGAAVASDWVDVYPAPPMPAVVSVKFRYLKKLSGKGYHPDTVKRILESLGFVLERETVDEVSVRVPFHKTDIQLPADLVEEVMRIDGLDNIDIPGSIQITPNVEADPAAYTLKEKIAGSLVGLGFHEILTNSITNSTYYGDDGTLVRLLNNLSTDLDVMRPSMLETGLEAIAYNINRKNADLRLFEFGKTYRKLGSGRYEETERLCLYLSGNTGEDTWRVKAAAADIYYIKGLTETILTWCGLDNLSQNQQADGLHFSAMGVSVAQVRRVDAKSTARFDVRQPVFFADVDWTAVLRLYLGQTIAYREVARFPTVQRDLALVLAEGISYADVETAAKSANIRKLSSIRLFDVFRSDKIGAGKKSMALSFTFQDEEKTLTDKEIEKLMQHLTKTIEDRLGATIRS